MRPFCLELIWVKFLFELSFGGALSQGESLIRLNISRISLVGVLFGMSFGG